MGIENTPTNDEKDVSKVTDTNDKKDAKTIVTMWLENLVPKDSVSHKQIKEIIDLIVKGNVALAYEKFKEIYGSNMLPEFMDELKRNGLIFCSNMKCGAVNAAHCYCNCPLTIEVTKYAEDLLCEVQVGYITLLQSREKFERKYIGKYIQIYNDVVANYTPKIGSSEIVKKRTSSRKQEEVKDYVKSLTEKVKNKDMSIYEAYRDFTNKYGIAYTSIFDDTMKQLDIKNETPPENQKDDDKRTRYLKGRLWDTQKV